MNTARVDGRTLRYQHRRPELLAAATEYVLDHGIGDLPLRQISQALGITHATLLRHFTTKEGLLLEILDRIRFDFQNQLRAADELRSTRTTAEFIHEAWTWLCEPRQQRQFILLFELVGRTAREPGRGGQLVQSIINDWLAPVEARLVQDGWSPVEALTMSTAVLAQVRGLQLDLIMTGDRTRVGRAFETVLKLVAQPKAQ